MPTYYILYKRIINNTINIIVGLFFCIFYSATLSFGYTNAKISQYNDIICTMSQKYEIEKELISNVIAVESDFDHLAVSKCDARGLMQITRQTWDWICREFLEVDWDYEKYAFDPSKNIEVGTRFLRWISDYLDKNKEELNDTKQNLMLACYNAGPGAVRKHGFNVPPFKETQDYLKKIAFLANYPSAN